jgi:hypothetical protein
MYFQRFLKGIPDLSAADAAGILTDSGILSNWWLAAGPPSGADIQRRLTWRNLDWHLNHYMVPDPLEGGVAFRDRTPFVSTTAGTVGRDDDASANVTYPAFDTALWFATREYKTSGYVFHGYVYALGKRSIALEAFSEEVRDLHVYTGYLPYQHEGEVTAKLRIPATCLERAELFDGPTAYRQLAAGDPVVPADVLYNPRFARPEAYVNLRDTLS